MNWEFSPFLFAGTTHIRKSLLKPPFWVLVLWEWVEFWLFQIISWYLVYSWYSFLLLPILVCYIFLGIYPLHLNIQLCFTTLKKSSIWYSPFSFCILFLCSTSQPHTYFWWKDCQYLLIFLICEKQSLLCWYFDWYFVDFYYLLFPSSLFLLMLYLCFLLLFRVFVLSCEYSLFSPFLCV